MSRSIVGRLGLSATAIKAMAERGRRFRQIILESGVPSHSIAKALQLSGKTVQDWREGREAIPPEYFEVIQAAWRRDNETYHTDDERGLIEFLPIYARASRLPGFRE